MRLVPIEERRARLAARHRLAFPSTGVSEAAEAMVGLHSSDPATVFLSAWARVPGLAKEDVESALYVERSVVRILAMRRTLFAVPVAMAPLLHHSSTVALMGPERRRLEDMVEKAGITDDGKAWVSRVAALTLEALRSRG
jgi:hypothetical protein